MSENKSDLELLNEKAYKRIVEIITGTEYLDTTSRLGAIMGALDNRTLAESSI